MVDVDLMKFPRESMDFEVMGQGVMFLRYQKIMLTRHQRDVPPRLVGLFN